MPGDLTGAVAEPLVIVGIGVSAESLGSLEQLIGDSSPDLGAAYVIAVQQLRGLSVQAVIEMLQRTSSLPARIATDGDLMQPDRIYIGGPDDMITVDQGHIAIRPAAEPVGHRGTVDTLLISLAEHAHERAVAVILSGLGADGSAGVTATKKFGGLSIAEQVGGEDPVETEGIGPSGVVDLNLAAGAMAAQIALYAHNLATLGEADVAEQVPEDVETQVRQITTVLRNVTGHDFHGYKRGTFFRRVQRRMQVLSVDTVAGYVARLREDRDEVQNLFQDLLIGVTQFFRDPAEFVVLEGEIPRLFEDKGPQDHVRVWVLGCATGEEAYSIAILLREHMATLDHPPTPQIFATDLDAQALNLARAGRYTDAIAQHIRPDRLERWFVREGDTYCVSKELREMCIFSPHNIVKDAPFSRIDILSCRNLLIYLNADLQNRVIPIFHFSLRPAGVLFLGSSENITRHQKLFAPVDRKNRVFRRLETATRIIPDFPLTGRPRQPEAQGAAPPPPRAAVGPLTMQVSRQADAIVERYTPAYVVIDAQFDIMHFSGRTGRYLEPSAGAATLNLLSLIHRDLRLDLRSALTGMIRDGGRIVLPHLIVREHDRTHAVNLIVEPVGGQDTGSIMVLFQDLGLVPDVAAADVERLANDEHVQRLDAELRSTRERLQATIEELESTNEELKSSNEEYQSINEELQSASEEMETSKEELQSINEELQTVNGELGHRVSELGRINSDLKNLLESTRIATVFLDNDLRVRNFTPSATEVFHLLDTDLGRPIDHVVTRVRYPELLADVRDVLRTLVPFERAVTDPDLDRHFVARILPYRSTDNYINGAVVTFTDLTAVNQAERALSASEKRYRAFVNASSDAVYRMNASWTEVTELDGRGFLPDVFTPATNWMDVYIQPEDQSRMQLAIDEAIRTRSMFELEHRIRRLDGEMGWTHSRAVPLIDANGDITEWIGTASDITIAHKAEVDRRAAEERLHSAIEVARVGTWDWNMRTGEMAWSDELFKMNGYAVGEVTPSYDGWAARVHPDDLPACYASLTHARDAHDEYVVEYRALHPDASIHWFAARGRFIYDNDGEPLLMIGAMIDITDAHEQRERQDLLVGELQHRTRNLMSVVRSVAEKTMRRAHDLDEFRINFRMRLDALARVQGLLSRMDDHDRVTFDELLGAELAAHGVAEDGSPRIVVRGPQGIRLRSSTVQLLALALHELATNAAKYGALKETDGRLEITWRTLDDEGDPPRLEIVWRESGVTMPPPGGPPAGSGQGRELLERALPYQLNAETSYTLGPDGVLCVMVIPISGSSHD